MRRILQLAGLMAGGLIVGLSLVEFGLRLAGISYPVFETYDPERGKVLRPGKAGWYRAEGEAFLEINQAGFRDRDHTLQKPADTFRIAVLGDSYVEAREVPMEQTFWSQLEHKLADCPRFEGLDIEVLSFGVSGYGTGEQLLTLQIDALKYEPDLVIDLFFAGNDLAENTPDISNNGTRGAGGETRPYFRVEDGVLTRMNSDNGGTLKSLQRRFLLEAIHHSRILEVVNQARRTLYARQFGQQGDITTLQVGLSEFVHGPPQTPEQEGAWVVTEALLAEIHREAKGHGSEFLLVTATTPIQVDLNDRLRTDLKKRLGVQTLDYAERRVEELGKQEGFPVLTEFEPFRQHAESQQIYLHGFPNTRMGVGHWNREGHSLAAELIADTICSPDIVRVAHGS